MCFQLRPSFSLIMSLIICFISHKKWDKIENTFRNLDEYIKYCIVLKIYLPMASIEQNGFLSLFLAKFCAFLSLIGNALQRAILQCVCAKKNLVAYQTFKQKWGQIETFRLKRKCLAYFYASHARTRPLNFMQINPQWIE